MTTEQAANWKKFETKISRLYSENVSNQPFSQYAWSEYFPEKIISFLIDEKPSYFGHKDAMFASLCAWITAPGSSSLRKAAASIAAIRAVSEIEDTICKIFPEQRLVATALISLVPQMRLLYEDIYYPLGGMRNAVIWPRQKNFRSLHSRMAARAYIVRDYVEVFRFHAENLGSDSYHTASIKKGTAAVRSKRKILEERNYDEDNTRKCYNHKVAALVYASSTIQTAHGSLLEAMIKGEADWRLHGGLFKSLVSKAVYIEENVIRKCYAMQKFESCLGYAQSLLPQKLQISDEVAVAYEAAFRRPGGNLGKAPTMRAI